MSKMRIYQLAKEFGVSSKELLEHLKDMGIDAKSGVNTLTDEEVEKVKESWSKREDRAEVVEKRISSRVIRRRTIAPKVVEREKPTKDKEEILEKELKEAEKPPHEKVEVETKVKEEKKAEEKRVEEKKEIPEKEIEPEKIEPKEAKPTFFQQVLKEKTKEEILEPEPKPEEVVAEEPVEEILPKDFKEVQKEEEEPGKEVQIEPKKKKKYRELIEDEVLQIRKKAKGRKVKFLFKEERIDFDREAGEEIEETDFLKKDFGEKQAEKKKKVEKQPLYPVKRKLKIERRMKVSELAKKMGIKFLEVSKKLKELGYEIEGDIELEPDVCAIVAQEFGCEAEISIVTVEDLIKEEEKEDKVEDLLPVPPVVTVMGHVDHGKTSLLDAIRNSRVTEEEKGGITQKIGASLVRHDRKSIVFIDTPGHQAFTEMRARGAKVTDIVVLVVAADDGVMPQTVEAINHAKDAGVPIIVAVNKIDKPGANPELVRTQLSNYDLVPEEWGGNTIFVNVSAKTKKGIDELLEMILLQAEMLELKANPKRNARGYIIESKIDVGKGPVATVIVKNGTLRVGDLFVAGKTFGKVRALIDDRGRRIKEAPPSTPVEVVGLEELPEAGDELIVIKDEKRFKKIIELKKIEEKKSEPPKKISLEDLFSRIKEGTKELKLIVKADTQGSMEAVLKAISEIEQKGVEIKVIHNYVGRIGESDVMLASASDALIIGFNVKIDPKASQLANREKVSIKTYSVIYDLIDDVKKALSGMLVPEKVEKVIGKVEVKRIFKVPKVGIVLGCYVQDGKVLRGAMAKVIKNGDLLYTTKISSLKRFKDDVKEVSAGYECGIGLEEVKEISQGDILEVFVHEEVKPEI